MSSLVTPYENLAGDAGVAAYEIAEESIEVEFTGGSAYLYDYDRPGRPEVEAMKRLARQGRGLSTFINRHVGKNYRKRLR